MKKILLLISIFLFAAVLSAQVQNSSTEVINYKEKDGFIIIDLTINGSVAPFLLDLAGKTLILDEFVDKFKIVDLRETSDKYPNNKIEIDKGGIIKTISFGNNVFANEYKVNITKDKENIVRELGVAGIVNGTLFKNCVLTIDKKNKRITTSIPYRPGYISIKEREKIVLTPDNGVMLNGEINGQQYKLLFDTWEKGLVTSSHKMGNGTSLKMINVNIPDPKIDIKKNVGLPTIGLGLLDHGIISIDYLRSTFYFQSHDKTIVKEEAKQTLSTIVSGKMNSITRDDFIHYIFDYKNESEFVLKGDKPVVIDFWASWCIPCMRMMPEMEKMAEKYKDKVIFYKVNADKEKELCAMFNVLALPTLFFIPKNGAPIVEVGALPEKYIEIIETKLL